MVICEHLVFDKFPEGILPPQSVRGAVCARAKKNVLSILDQNKALEIFDTAPSQYNAILKSNALHNREANMHLKSVETTPNPNSMKLNLDENVGAATTYTVEDGNACPHYVKRLLEIEGVKSIFVCQDFLTLNKDPRANWKTILEKSAALLGGKIDSLGGDEKRLSAEKSGQVQVLVQTYKGIPIQIKVVDSKGESRVSLGERFNEAAQFVQAESGADFLKERYWADYGARYGECAEIAKEVAEELQGIFNLETLQRTKLEALGKEQSFSVQLDTIKNWLNSSDWHRRLAAIQELSLKEGNEIVSLLVQSLSDENPQVRRLCAAALGATGNIEAVKPLCHSLLHDSSPGVRRTAGDALSDIGDSSAQASMIESLKDQNKLVRWRAARFLNDLGTEEALPALELAKDDSEYEVQLEIKAAIERIQKGGQGLGPVWKRIVEQE